MCDPEQTAPGITDPRILPLIFLVNGVLITVIKSVAIHSDRVMSLLGFIQSSLFLIQLHYRFVRTLFARNITIKKARFLAKTGLVSKVTVGQHRWGYNRII